MHYACTVDQPIIELKISTNQYVDSSITAVLYFYLVGFIDSTTPQPVNSP